MNRTPSSSEKKTNTVSAFVTVTVADHACCKGMAWESPRIIFEVWEGMEKAEYVWHSEQVAEILKRHGIDHGRAMVGQDYAVEIKVRGNRVWRVIHFSPVL